MNICLSYIPFLYPISLFHDWWYILILPLSFGISIIYKALRLGSLDRFWHNVVMMSIQIILSMIGLAIALLILVQWIIPVIPVD